MAAKAKGTDKASKDGEELDQVAGNAEDEIGDRVAGVRETEMLYGTDSLLAMYGPMVVHICGSPHKFKVRALSKYAFWVISILFAEPNTASSCNAIVQQVPLRQFAILRPAPPAIV